MITKKSSVVAFFEEQIEQCELNCQLGTACN